MTVYGRTDRIEVLSQELLRSKGARGSPDVVTAPWGTKPMEIEDPSGNLLRFNEEASA